MSKILDPANSSDQRNFATIAEMTDIKLTAVQLDVRPEFQAAENYIVSLIPTAELPSGRTISTRDDVVLALEFLAASKILEGAGSNISNTTSSGAVTSRAIGPVRVSYSAGGEATSTFSDVEDRVTYYKKEADAILQRLTGSSSLSDDGFNAYLTYSKLW